MTDQFSLYLMLIPLLPLLSALLTAALGAKVLKQWSHLPTIFAFAGSFVCSIQLAMRVALKHEDADTFSAVYTFWQWASISDAISTSGGSLPLNIEIALRADGLTSIMLCMVTFVSTLVAIFAAGYMKGDRGYWRFFTYVSLFVFSMTMLVSASNFMLLFVFWEAVGVCSYLLIGFWYQKPAAAAAGKKAFIVNRVGDFTFILALFFIFMNYNTLNFHDVSEAKPAFRDDVVNALSSGGVNSSDSLVEGIARYEYAKNAPDGVLSETRIKNNDYVTGGTALLICLLLLGGACGKSAQFPLHVWLPDAMEGPTPVSALIHAATMVTAGVYMVVRSTPLFTASPDAQVIVSIIGGTTALLAGLIALSQYDLKRVLAYSTVSQLGYMFLALGIGTMGGITAGMFHLFTHAFFKALLFLGAGSVMHAMGNVIDMRRFGGLRHVMPITFWTFAFGCVALAGIVPFSGFWSKDSILGALADKQHAIAAQVEERSGAEHSEEEHASGHGGHHVARDASTERLTDAQLQWHGTAFYVLNIVATFTAFLTAFYTFRAFFMTFYGEKKVPAEAHGHAHESPPLMWVPLAILAICAAGIGAVMWATDGFALFLEHTPSLAGDMLGNTPKLRRAAFHGDVALFSTLVALAGAGGAAYFYLGSLGGIEKIRAALDMEFAPRAANVRWRAPFWKLKSPYILGMTVGFLLLLFVIYGISETNHKPGEGGWMEKAVYIDALPQLYDTSQATPSTVEQFHWLNAAELAVRNIVFIWLAVHVVWAVLLAVLYLSPVALWLSPYKLSYGKFFIDEIYDLFITKPLKLLAMLCFGIDRWLIDAGVNLAARVPPMAGGFLRSLQTGLVQFYAIAMLLGVVVILAATWYWTL